MLKKLFLFLIVIAIVTAWLGGIFSISLNPFSFDMQVPEKDFVKRVATKTKNLIYREATLHNPPGDMVPDQMDDSFKNQIKKIVN